MGVGKAKLEKRRSFIFSNHTQAIARALIQMGKSQLARFCAVAYTYQLRVQSEGITLQAKYISDDEFHKDDWWSGISFSKKQVHIHLVRRKNKEFKSTISRPCTCASTKWACGACAIRHQLGEAKRQKQARLFWEVSNSDIKIIQKIALQLNIPYPTWHGFRRGRTCDLVSSRNEGQPISLEDVFESGGWLSGSRSILHYLKRETVDRDRVVSALSELSDSD